ncbi:MAG: pantetheine-phosphate adenylyltransferase [Coriobacteriales bacterium]|nr:pantetheine-phosphate adenylyltransferase [Coriobacteriales bacterium]
MKALVPGTFDPITAGHLDVIERAAQLFDHVVVGVAESPRKGSGPIFSMQERAALIREATSHLPNVSVEPFSNLLVEFAKQIGASVVVKGLRAVTDFESEFQQAAINYTMNPDVETLFIMSAPEHMYLSSSVVREIAFLHGDIDAFVPANVAKALRDKFGY